MIKYYYKSAKDKSLKTLEEFKGGSWVYAENPSEKELSFLHGKLGLDEGLLKDAVDENEVPRLEIEDKVIYIYLRFAKEERNRAITTPVLIALGPNYVATIGAKADYILENVLKFKNGYSTSHKTTFLLKLLTIINSSYHSQLREISKKVRPYSIRLERIENRDIAAFVVFENALNDFLSALIPANAVFSNLLSERYLTLNEESKDLVEDLKLSNNEIIELSKSTLRTIVNVREAYSTIVTNNLNAIIKLLTSFTVILAIPTMIASFFGMNVPIPFSDNILAFPIIIFVSLLISIILLIVFLKKDWL